MFSIEEFLGHFRRQRRWTFDLIRAVPEEHFDWAPAPDAFSCGGLVAHLIASELFWRRLILGAVAGEPHDPFGLAGSAREKLEAFRPTNVAASRSGRFGTSFAACLESWSEIQAKTEAALAGLPPQAFAEVRVRHPLTELEAPAWEFLLIMVEHEAHHRGQLSAYLKQLGLPQPPVMGTP
ncbi:MAG: DinB family protein [Thermoanaerobaculia bacterium]